MLLKPSVRLTSAQVPVSKSFLRPAGGRCGRVNGVGSMMIRAAAGGGVADKPVTKPEKNKRMGTSRKRPPIYRVLLHNDNYNSREYVVRVLVKVIDCLSLDDAVNVMQVAHVSGIALVTACAQEEAETYCQGLRNNGLTSTIEPDGGPGNGEV